MKYLDLFEDFGLNEQHTPKSYFEELNKCIKKYGYETDRRITTKIPAQYGKIGAPNDSYYLIFVLKGGMTDYHIVSWFSPSGTAGIKFYSGSGSHNLETYAGKNVRIDNGKAMDIFWEYIISTLNSGQEY